MRIVCPSCAARYEIADGMLAKPRTVRCSRCAREWVQDPVPPAEPEFGAAETDEFPPAQEPDSAAAPAPESVASFPLRTVTQEPPASPQPMPLPPAAKRDDGAVRLAWIASLLLLAALAIGAYKFRADIQAAWPPSERLYRLLPA
jgi:predicted Zn finger-like uncharacterized protein